ncbi:exopolyphosphatase [Bifidobacterium saguini DSM 23967]|uniref:Exopolyphosphatase n=2 Tax=Bifidobacterium saguini TaxID=762210 RepID=A0A087DF40_9BIFI|nr:ATP-binding protein [Bifidobacterium saguini]KFI94140.1 exopolyphosphatase [Bifidobacterium saguini DSM 23967]QTB90440.1 ATP-binding protein [Bifidobacterium saguini]
MNASAVAKLPLHSLNPFMPGAGKQPPELVGRTHDLELMDRMIARTKLGLLDRGIVYSGLRGMGKTVLLLKLNDMATQQGMVTVQIESNGDAAAEYDELLHEMSLSIMRVRKPDIRERLSGVFSHIGSVNLDFVLGSAKIELNGSAEEQRAVRASSYRLELLIEGLAEALKSNGLGLFLFVDEFQDMSSEVMMTLITVQHKMGQRNLPFYIIGAGLPNLPGVLTKARSYAERLFEYRSIGRLDNAAVADGFQKPARELGYAFDDQALSRLIDLSNGYPYFIQAYGKAAWDASDSNPITVDAVEKGEPVARAELDQGLYVSRWQRATPLGREYLAAMAAIGDICTSAQVANHMGRSVSDLSSIRLSLIELGLIYSPERGQIAFTVPGMDEFIRRAMPAETQSYDGRD